MAGDSGERADALSVSFHGGASVPRFLQRLVFPSAELTIRRGHLSLRPTGWMGSLVGRLGVGCVSVSDSEVSRVYPVWGLGLRQVAIYIPIRGEVRFASTEVDRILTEFRIAGFRVSASRSSTRDGETT
jgi:hypothetical protein